jgi:predicted metal-dependent peptidase
MDAITEAINTLVRRATMQLMVENPCYGVMSVYLTLVDDSENTKTFGTDGDNLYYNRDFFVGLTFGEMKFILTQVNLMIMTRALENSPEKSNQYCRAADHIFSDMIIAENIGKIGKTIGPLVDYDKDLINRKMATHEAFSALVAKEGENNNPSALVDHSYHIKMEEDDDEIGSSGTRSGLMSRIKAAVAASSSAGITSGMPSMLAKLLEEFSAPKIDYAKHIAEFTQSAISNGTSYDRFNKRSTDDYMLHGKKPGNHVKYGFAIDTSGSMDDDMLHDGLVEVVGSAEQFPDYEIHVFCFDTSVHNYQVFTPDNIDTLKEYQCEGGGGTIFSVAYEFIKENKIDIDKFIMFTDGFDSGDCGLQYRDVVDTLFVVHSNDNFEPGFGEVTYYK